MSKPNWSSSQRTILSKITISYLYMIKSNCFDLGPLINQMQFQFHTHAWFSKDLYFTLQTQNQTKFSCSKIIRHTSKQLHSKSLGWEWCWFTMTKPAFAFILLQHETNIQEYDQVHTPANSTQSKWAYSSISSFQQHVFWPNKMINHIFVDYWLPHINHRGIINAVSHMLACPLLWPIKYQIIQHRTSELTMVFSSKQSSTGQLSLTLTDTLTHSVFARIKKKKKLCGGGIFADAKYTLSHVYFKML